MSRAAKHDHVSLNFKFAEAYREASDFQYVQLAKHKTKRTKEKILIVLDYMPQEDLKAGRILSGMTGTLLKRLDKVASRFYNSDRKLNDYNWLAISYHAFKIAGESDAFREGAQKQFKQRLSHIIVEYKPDVVLTFGPDPYRALNAAKINRYGGKMQHLFGVPVATKVKYREKEHRFRHVPSISLNTLVNDKGKGSEMALAGYVARNMVNALNKGLKYKIPRRPEFATVLIDSIPKFDKMLKTIKKAKYLAVDTESTSLNRRVNRMLTIQFACSTKRAFVVPIEHKDSPFSPKELKYIKKKLCRFFERDNQNEQQVYANASFDLTLMRVALGVRFFKAPLWDLFAGEFSLDENMKGLTGVTGFYYYSLLNLSMQYGCTAYYEAEFGKENRKTIVSADLNDALLEYCSLDVIVPLYIMRAQKKRAKDIGYDKYESIVSEQISDMLHVFSELEYNGAYTDIEYLFYLKTKNSPIRKEIDGILERLKATKGVRRANAILGKKKGMPSVGLWGKSTLDLFDISKQDHIRLLFFEVLKLKPIQVGKSGHGKVDKKFQEKYKDTEEVALFTELQRANKLYNAYVKSFIKNWAVDEDMRSDQRIRPHFQFLDVVTGRTSAKKPSLHQIPSRSELGKHIKRLFITEMGRVMIKVDYSAHEVRCFHLDSYVKTERGMEKFRDILAMPMSEKPLVHSFNHDTQQIELKPIGTQSVHAPEEDMYEIEYEGGTITLTGNHPVWSKTRNAYIRADEITADEEVIIDESRTQQEEHAMGRRSIEFSKTQINKMIRMFEKDRLSTSKIGREFGVSCNTIIKALRANGVEVSLSDRRTKQFTEPQRKNIVRRYADGRGESTIDLAEAFSCSYATIRRVLREENVYNPSASPRNKIELTEKQKAKILLDYSNGASARALSKELGCNDSVVRGFLRSQGIDTRDFGRGNRSSIILNRGHWRTSRALTQRMYKDHKHFINPNNLPIAPEAHHIDHRLSIAVGLHKKLTVLDLAHPCNLQVLTAADNYSKYIRCDIEKRDLLNEIKEWNRERGDPFAEVDMEIEYEYRYGRYRYFGGAYRYFGGNHRGI